MRWWDGAGWTEHVSVPEPEEPEVVNPYMIPRVAEEVDDGQLHPRARELVFANASRGAVQPLSERAKITTDALTSLRAVQVYGALAFSAMFMFIAVRGVLHWGGWIAGGSLVIAALIPFGIRAVVQLQVRNEFWFQWCVSRGFEVGVGEGPGGLLPKGLNRSPLIGPLESRVVELAARRMLLGREAVIGCLLRIVPPAEGLDPASAPELHRATFILMPMPDVAAARWAGASIRADHHARRPLTMRTMLGALAPSAVAGARAHLSIVEHQDPHVLHRLADGRLDEFLAEHPIDVDIVEDLLVVTQDGEPAEDDHLDDLCRAALLIHELLVAEHELPIQLEETPTVMVVEPDEELSVIDRDRAGWGDELQEFDSDQLAA